MAVAETTMIEGRTPQRPYAELGWKSAVGAGVVLLAFGFLFTGLPILWTELGIAGALNNEFLSQALLLLISLAVATGEFLGIRRLEQTHASIGARAGTAFLVLYVIFVLWVVSWLGAALWQLEMVGAVLLVGLIGALSFYVYRLFHRPGFCQWLVGLEEQGWFHWTSYKGNQGVRVRRGTVIALLVLGISGIITLVSHGSVGSSRAGTNDWYMWIPFVGSETYGYVLPILFNVSFTVPILLALACFWFAWRITNWPTFADFLIATEAEMNKVSWTSRKRLFQDTVVVLVTVFILTTFLFVVDIVWIKVLSNRWINVLQVDIKAEQAKQQEKTQW